MAKDSGASSIAIDDSGVGGGVTDLLIEFARAEQSHIVVDGVIVGAKSYESTRFANLRAQIFWSLREAFEKGQISILSDDDLKGQLCAIKYGFNNKGQILIESKEDMRATKGSPDRADALALAFYGINYSATKAPFAKAPAEFTISWYDAMEKKQSRRRGALIG